MTQSPSHTVSIYEALAEILSKPTESLNFLNNKSTDSTFFSEAPISSTTQSTTTTTTSSTTTEQPSTTMDTIDDIKVENSTIELHDNNQSVNIDTVYNETALNEEPTIEISSETTQINPVTTTDIPITQSLIKRVTDNNLENNSKLPTNIKEDATQNLELTLNFTDNTNDTFKIIDTNLTKIMVNNTEPVRYQSNAKALRINAPNEILRNNLEKSTSTELPSYSPRFSNSNRIPILPVSFQKSNDPDEKSSRSPLLDLMTYKITKHAEEFPTTPSVFPIYRPEFETTTISMLDDEASSKKSQNERDSVTDMIAISSGMVLIEEEQNFTTESLDLISTTVENIDRDNSTELNLDSKTQSKTIDNGLSDSMTASFQNSLPSTSPSYTMINTTVSITPTKSQEPETSTMSKVNEIVIYGILSNNTVIRKYIQHPLTTENPYVIFGILPNKTRVRKYPNGTVVSDDPITRIEITNIDPTSLTNPNSEFYQKRQQNINQHKTSVPTTNMPITETIKTVFQLQT